MFRSGKEDNYNSQAMLLGSEVCVCATCARMRTCMHVGVCICVCALSQAAIAIHNNVLLTW